MNRTTGLVNISLIRVDRYPMNRRTLDLIDYLRDGGSVPPIKITKHPLGGFMIKDGRHRLLAHKMLGLAKIKASYSNQPIQIQ